MSTRQNQNGNKSTQQHKNSQGGGQSQHNSQAQHNSQHTAMEDPHRGGWGAFAGLITFVLIAFPLSATVAFATNPQTQKLFGSHLADASQFGYRAFGVIL